MLGLLTLAAAQGTELVVAADGDDAGPALDRVAALLAADDPAARAAAAERG
jgi:phosphotransferase system HPr-like phosphotransfer protein